MPFQYSKRQSKERQRVSSILDFILVVLTNVHGCSHGTAHIDIPGWCSRDVAPAGEHVYSHSNLLVRGILASQSFPSGNSESA